MEKFRFLLYLHRTWIVSEPYLLRTISSQRYLYLKIVRSKSSPGRKGGASMAQVHSGYTTDASEVHSKYSLF